MNNAPASRIAPFSHLKKYGRFLIIFLAVIFVLVAIATGVLLAYGSSYSGKVLQGVYIGEFSVAGLTESELSDFLKHMTAKRLNEGVEVSFESPLGTKQLVLNSGAVSKEDEFGVSIDIVADAKHVYNYGKIGNIFVDSWSAFAHNFFDARLKLSTLEIDTDRLYADLDTKLSSYKKDAITADVIIKKEDPLEYAITTSSPGFSFEYGDIVREVEDAWSTLRSARITITSVVTQPEVTEKDLNNIQNQLKAVFNAGPHTIVHYDEHAKRNYSWTISKKQIADWVRPMRRADGTLSFGLGVSSTADFIRDKIAPDIDVEPKDAVFELNSSSTKAKKIVGHRPGVTVDTNKVLQDVNDAFATRIVNDKKTANRTTLAVATVDPKVKLGDTNNLGIKEVLGTGYSNFSGSPRNRILNIKNAVMNKLHGTIVKPDEEFSLVATLRPFTLEAGYLPELVIVGDRIKPEIAGGLCQVGTTMFRSAMNSGMPITQRVNHGLVVNYYNDLSNGKPGTDATIYDGWPDFRFKNDTGHHIAITVSMNESTKDLAFTFWGTSDGRKGYYAPPIVDAWIPAGPYKEIHTTDLAPGKKECQSVHPGAKTHFVYTRELPNGEKENKVFSSVYRAVPATCYVGVSETPVCKEGEECPIKPTDGIEKPKDDAPVSAGDLGIVFPTE